MTPADDATLNTCKPPAPDTRKPGFELPADACDAHCHVFGPGDRFPYAEGRSYTPPDAPVENFRKMQAVLGFSRAVIVQAGCHGTDNAAMLDAIASSEGRYRGVAMVNDSFSDAALETLHEGGVRGVRFSFARHLGRMPDFNAVSRTVERIAPLGWHLVLYLEPEDIVEFADILPNYELPVVIDHMGRVKTGGGLDQEAFRLLLDFIRGEDFWVKISGAERNSTTGPPYEDAVPYAQALINAAPGQVLWGTDWPHPNTEGPMPNDGDLADLFALYAPDAALRERILVDNPARLYGFDA
jgi:predicted TIM-barrel fold metal-dependent hydrolase